MGDYRNIIQHASLIRHKYNDVFDFMTNEMPKIINVLSKILGIKNVNLAGGKFRSNSQKSR
jgi:hypothetical protein